MYKRQALLKEDEELCEEIANKVKEHSADLLMKTKMEAMGGGAPAAVHAPEPPQTAVPQKPVDIDIEADESDFE